MHPDLQNLLSTCEVGKVLIAVTDKVHELCSILLPLELPCMIKESIDDIRSLLNNYLDKLCDIALAEPKSAPSLHDVGQRYGGFTQGAISAVRENRQKSQHRFVKIPGLTGIRKKRSGSSSSKGHAFRIVPLHGGIRFIRQKSFDDPENQDRLAKMKNLAHEIKELQALTEKSGAVPNNDTLSFGFRPQKARTVDGLENMNNQSSNGNETDLPLVQRNVLLSVTKYLAPGVLPYFHIRNAADPIGNPEFLQFQNAFIDYRFRITMVMTALKDFLATYQIPLARINPAKFGQLIVTLGLRQYFTKDELLNLLDNRAEIERLIKTPGSKFKGPNARIAAAVVIQSNWRRFVTRRWYLAYRKQRAAANTISKIWLQWMRTKAIREKVMFTREASRAFYFEKLEHHDYQQRFLRLAAVCNEVSEDSLSKRLVLHVPALVGRFPAFHFCLSTILKYSGSSLHKLRQLATERPAVLIGGYPHMDDLEVAREIGIPYLGTDPYVAKVYGTKSGAIQIFREAGVAVPPSEGDIFSEQQLIESLSTLIILNLEISTWIIKTNHSRDSRGFAWLHIGCISCISFLRLQREKKKDQWSLHWAHEPFVEKLQSELRQQLPKHYTVRSRSHDTTWKDYVREFVRYGGIIQAVPAAADVTCLTCDLFISPVGKMTIESSGDQIPDKFLFSKLGYSIPQTSVAAQDFLIDYCEKIGKTAYNRGIIGYISVDFVTFFEGQEQILWTLDWNIGTQDSTALSKVIKFSLNAWTSQTSLMLETFPFVPLSRRKRNLEAKELAPKPMRRFAVVSSALYHSHLEIIHPNVFYQICKSISLELDPNTKQGSILLPLDHSKKTMLGMCVIADSLHKALKIYSKNLKLMNEEITSTTIQGESNFITAACAMDKIAKQVEENDR